MRTRSQSVMMSRVPLLFGLCVAIGGVAACSGSAGVGSTTSAEPRQAGGVTTATAPVAPSASPVGGISHTKPAVAPAYQPPDPTQSALTMTVSGTRFVVGQGIEVRSRGPRELAGQDCFVLAQSGENLTVLATGAVNDSGGCALVIVPTGQSKIRSAVAPGSAGSSAPARVEDFVALSSAVDISPTS
ncbi:MAG: hypothetical protein WCI74_00280 [Actinomycetes bacterium]